MGVTQNNQVHIKAAESGTDFLVRFAGPREQFAVSLEAFKRAIDWRLRQYDTVRRVWSVASQAEPELRQYLDSQRLAGATVTWATDEPEPVLRTQTQPSLRRDTLEADPVEAAALRSLVNRVESGRQGRPLPKGKPSRHPKWQADRLPIPPPAEPKDVPGLRSWAECEGDSIGF